MNTLQEVRETWANGRESVADYEGKYGRVEVFMTQHDEYLVVRFFPVMEEWVASADYVGKSDALAMQQLTKSIRLVS